MRKSLITRNFHTIYELCDFIKQNNIDVYSEDVKYLGEYIFSPQANQPRQTLVCYASSNYGLRPPKYTIQYEDYQGNVGLLDSHYVEDFSED